MVDLVSWLPNWIETSIALMLAFIFVPRIIVGFLKIIGIDFEVSSATSGKARDVSRYVESIRSYQVTNGSPEDRWTILYTYGVGNPTKSSGEFRGGYDSLGECLRMALKWRSSMKIPATRAKIFKYQLRGNDWDGWTVESVEEVSRESIFEELYPENLHHRGL